MISINLKKYLDLLRVTHWFKNSFLLVGAAAFFLVYPSVVVLNITTILNLFLAIFLTSLISSANYIINQITDLKFDKQHVDKKKRPLPSGKIPILFAYVICLVLFVLSVIFSRIFFHSLFQVVILIFFIAGIIYNIRPVRFKDVPYLDVISESFNNPIRFLLGWYVFTLNFPPLILLFWSWALGAFLMTAKRYDELLFYGKELVPYRQTFKVYSLFKLKNMMLIYFAITAVLLIMFTLNVSNKLFFFTIPFLLFLFWIMKTVFSGKAMARSVETFVLSKNFLFLGTLVIISYVLSLYF